MDADQRSSTDVSKSESPLWRNRDFMILWTGETISSLGSSMSFFLLPILAYTLTRSGFAAGMAGAAYTLGRLLTRIPAGAFVDRWSRRLVMILANVLGSLGFGTVALLLLLGRLNLTSLVIVAFVIGVIFSFFTPAEQASVRQIVSTKQLPTALSQNEARQHGASLVGPPLGGVLFAFDRVLPFAIDAVTYLVSALAICSIKVPLSAPSPLGGRSSLISEMVQGVRFLLSRAYFRAFVIFTCILNFASSALYLAVIVSLTRWGVQSTEIGAVQAAAGASGLAGSIAAPSLIRRIPGGILTMVGAGLIVLLSIPMAFTDNVLIIGVLFALPLTIIPAIISLNMARLMTLAPEHLQGRTTSALGFANSVFMPLAPLIGGAAAGGLGWRPSVLAISGLFLCGFVALALSQEMRTLSTPDLW